MQLLVQQDGSSTRSFVEYELKGIIELAWVMALGPQQSAGRAVRLGRNNARKKMGHSAMRCRKQCWSRAGVVCSEGGAQKVRKQAAKTGRVGQDRSAVGRMSM